MEFGGGVAIKILSDDVLHKSDVGGVALDLFGPRHVEVAAEAMLERVRAAKPDAAIEGFSVQPMIRRPGAHELIVGVITDSTFGPLVLFGEGGTAVELMNDKALALPPLNMKLAHEVVAQTRIYRLLKGYRDRPPAALDAIASTLIKVAQLVIDHPEIEELDINPLLADDFGVIALDVRVKLQASDKSGPERLAIRPYPKELEESVTLTARPNASEITTMATMALMPTIRFRSSSTAANAARRSVPTWTMRRSPSSGTSTERAVRGYRGAR